MNDIKTYLHSQSTSYEESSIRGRLAVTQIVSHLHQHESFVKVLSQSKGFICVENSKVNSKAHFCNRIRQLELSKDMYGSGSSAYQIMLSTFANEYITANTWALLKPSESIEIGTLFTRLQCTLCKVSRRVMDGIHRLVIGQGSERDPGFY